jgi:hypothetical protein
MARPIHVGNNRHGRLFESQDREIQVVSRRYPGETFLWAHVRPLGSTADFIPVSMDPHSGPGSLARVLKEAQDFDLDSARIQLAEAAQGEAITPRPHDSTAHRNGQDCTDSCFEGA